jgi:hypothetical protein
MRNPLYRSKSKFSSWNLAKYCPKKNIDYLQGTMHICLLTCRLTRVHFQAVLFMWKLTFILCENCITSNLLCTKPIILWMRVNLSHVSCQMFLVKLLILYMIDFISCVLLSHVFHWIYPMWFGKCSLCCRSPQFPCVLWNWSLGALSITPYQCFFFNSFSFLWCCKVARFRATSLQTRVQVPKAQGPISSKLNLELDLFHI